MKRNHTSKGSGRRSSPPHVATPAFAGDSRPTARPNSPKLANIVVTDDLAPNDAHPLAGMTAERRSADRVRTVAVVLAKLARRQDTFNDSVQKEDQ